MCFRINFWKWISSIFERIWSSIPQQTPPRAVPSCAGFGNLRITKEPNGTLNLGVAIFPPQKKGWRFCWWKKSCTTSDVKFIKIPCKWWDKLPIRTYKLVQGFLPSAVCHILASSYGGHCSRVLRYPVYTEGGVPSLTLGERSLLIPMTLRGNPQLGFGFGPWKSLKRMSYGTVYLFGW